MRGIGVMSCLWSGPPGFNCWISFAPVFRYVYLCFISFLFLDLCELEDYTSISNVSFMRTKLIHIRRIKGEGWYRYKCLRPPVIFCWPFQSGTSFVDPFCHLFLLSLLCLNVCSLYPCDLWESADRSIFGKPRVIFTLNANAPQFS